MIDRHSPLHAIAYEQLVVGRSATGLTSTVYAAAGLDTPKLAIVTVSEAGMRFRADGSDPTHFSTGRGTGTPVGVRGRIAIWGKRDIARIKFIQRDDDATVLDVEYFA